MINILIKKILDNNKDLGIKLKKGYIKKTPTKYVSDTINMTIFSSIFFMLISFLFFKSNLVYLFFSFSFMILIFPFISFHFWFNYVNIQIRKIQREQDNDLLFVLDFFLVSLSSGITLSNAVYDLAKLKRPGAIFFKKINDELRLGSDLEVSLKNGIEYCASDNLKNLLKKLKDSIEVGIDISKTLEILIKDSSNKKQNQIKNYTKKINPLVTMYLLLGIVLPSLGITFFIIGATIIGTSLLGLRIILFMIFITVFVFLYISYTLFRFQKISI